MGRCPTSGSRTSGWTFAVSDKWLWVSLSWATFGLGLRDGRVVEAAPIAKWCIGKTESYVVNYWRRRGARIEYL